MRPAQKALLTLVESVFDDGVVTSDERKALTSAYRAGGLTVPEVREVFCTFVETTWATAVADRDVTSGERAKMTTIVRELRLPRDCVPSALAWMVAVAA